MAKVIPSSWEEVPATIKSRFGTHAGKQRTMFHDGHFVLVAHVVPSHDQIERKAAIFWRHPSGAWKAAGEAKGNLSALKALVESYLQRAIELEHQFEGAKRAADYFSLLQEAAPLLRAARHLHKTLQEAREILPLELDLIGMRDIAGDAERTAELVMSDAKAGLDFTVAQRAEEQAETQEHIARSSHRLNLIAALFLPVSAIGSVFGVNLMHGLETKASPWLFWAFIVLSFIVGFIVRSSIDKRDDVKRK